MMNRFPTTAVLLPFLLAAALAVGGGLIAPTAADADVGAHTLIAVCDEDGPSSIAEPSSTEDGLSVWTTASELECEEISSSVAVAGGTAEADSLIFAGADGASGEQDGTDVIAIDPALAVAAAGQEVPDYSGGHVIALIDSGCDAGATGVLARFSVLGDDGADATGHGTAMAAYMIDQNPDARIVSIKALDDTGLGTGASVSAAIQLAINMKVEVINLSISAKAEKGSSVVEAMVNRAYEAGIQVVCAAGNDGSDASGFVPGCIDRALVVGACDTFGEKLPSSNFGRTVDFYVRSGSTSEAAARMSCMVAHVLAVELTVADINEPETVFIPTGDEGYATTEGYAGSGSDGLFRGQMKVDYWCVSDVSGSHHFALFTQISDWNIDLETNATWGYAWNSGGSQVAVHKSDGSWTRQGRTYNYAWVFDSTALDCSRDVYIAIEQSNNRRYTEGWYWMLLQRVQWDSPLDLAHDSDGITYSRDKYGYNVNIGLPSAGARSYPTATYDANGGTDSYSRSSSYSRTENVGVPWDYYTPPTMTGYTCDGYTVDRREKGQAAPSSDYVLKDDGSGNGLVPLDGAYFKQDSYNGVTDVFPWALHDYTLYAHWNLNHHWLNINLLLPDGTEATTGKAGTFRVSVDGGTTWSGDVSDQTSACDAVGYASEVLIRDIKPAAGLRVASVDGAKNLGDGTYRLSMPDSQAEVNVRMEYGTYTVNFDANGGIGTMEDQVMTCGNSEAIAACAFERAGYDFAGWNTATDGGGDSYADGDSVLDLVPTGEVTLYAQWELKTFTVEIPTKIAYASMPGGAVDTSVDYKVNVLGDFDGTVSVSSTAGDMTAPETSDSLIATASSSASPLVFSTPGSKGDTTTISGTARCAAEWTGTMPYSVNNRL